MSARIDVNSTWCQIASGWGRGVKHRVIWRDHHEIITWTPPFDGERGASWMGTPDQFVKKFRLVAHPPNQS